MVKCNVLVSIGCGRGLICQNIHCWKNYVLCIFIASALWADAFYRLKCPSVCLFVCLFEVPFNGLFAPTSRNRMSNIFRDSESLGKSNGKKWTDIWTFLFGSGLKLPRKKKVFFLLILPYKTWWKPHFQMDKRPLVEGPIANFGISLDVFEFLRFGRFFSVFQKNWVFWYFWSTRKPRFPMD